MDISRCNDMEELISDAGASTSFSFSLSRLPLDSLHELNCISRQPLTLPYLKSIEGFDLYLWKNVISGHRQASTKDDSYKWTQVKFWPNHYKL
ncbi:hypothetical protein BHM03_00057486 [Ensete ventricosum]|nr:hypothetical protein BHM03_00057486 [Ensete ventricosum]